MRVLFVTAIFPRDFAGSVYGVFQRTRMWLDAIQSVGAELEILFLPPHGVASSDAAPALARQVATHWGIRSTVTICEREPEERPTGRWAAHAAAYLRPALGFSRTAGFRLYSGKRQREAFAACLSRSPDVVFFQRLYPTGCALSTSLTGTRVLLDLDDVEHVRFAREIEQAPRWLGKRLLYLQLPALWYGERAAIKRADHAFVCSRSDRRYLERSMRVRNVEVIPNAVPRIPDGPLTNEPTVLFIGNNVYGPNRVAAEYLIRDVWPHIVTVHPRARLLIAGPNSEYIPAFRCPPPGVEFLGFVPDLHALYRRTRVVCCPIQSGGGTRVKILEAASYGVPVVATPLAAEGLDLVPEREILLRRDARGLAQACADLIADDARAARVGAAAQDRVRDVYSRDAVVQRIAAILVGATANGIAVGTDAVWA